AGQDATAEGDDSAGGICDREHEAVAEAVEQPAARAGPVAAEDEAGRQTVLDREAPTAEMANERLAVRRGISEPEPADGFLAHPTVGQVRARPRAAFAGELGLEDHRPGRGAR